MADISRYGLPISIVDPTNTTLFATVNSQGALLVDNSSATPVVQGTVTAIPSGTYTIAPDSGSLFTVVQSTTSSQSVYGTITSVPTGTYTVDGSVSVGNFPATQTVDGTVTAVPTGTYTVSFGGTQTVDGTVTAVPTGTYTVDGSVSVGNFPATQTVDGTVTAVPTGTYTVSFGGTQTVDGTVTAVPTGTYTIAPESGALFTVVPSASASQSVYGTVTATPSGIYTISGAGTMHTPSGGVVSVSDLSVGDVLVSLHQQSSAIGTSSTATVATFSIASPDIFNMRSVIASASSGPCKVSVKDSDGSTIATGFFSSMYPTVQIGFPAGYTISGKEIRVLVTNNAVTSQDLYASIMGRTSTS